MDQTRIEELIEARARLKEYCEGGLAVQDSIEADIAFLLESENEEPSLSEGNGVLEHDRIKPFLSKFSEAAGRAARAEAANKEGGAEEQLETMRAEAQKSVGEAIEKLLEGVKPEELENGITPKLVTEICLSLLGAQAQSIAGEVSHAIQMTAIGLTKAEQEHSESSDKSGPFEVSVQLIVDRILPNILMAAVHAPLNFRPQVMSEEEMQEMAERKENSPKEGEENAVPSM